jgi:hypothetical protein
MHKVVKAVTTGSVGDLGRIAAALAAASPPFDIATIGGGEGTVGREEVGIISILVRNDEGREDELVELVRDVDLGSGRRFASVASHWALLVDLTDEPGSLADCAERIGNVGANILGVLLVGIRGPKARVAFGFGTEAERDDAAAALEGHWTVVDHHDH